jgi:hypothetical protein
MVFDCERIRILPCSRNTQKSLEQVAAVFGDNLQADEEDLRRQVQREVWAETSKQEQIP